MFSGATNFNNGAGRGVLDPVNNAFYWDTGKVSTMSNMFPLAISFNQHIGTFNTNNTTDITTMVGSANFKAPNTPLLLTAGIRLTYAQLIASPYLYSVKELTTITPIIISSVLALDGKAIITYTLSSVKFFTIKTQYSLDNSSNWTDCVASSNTSSIITGLTNGISYNNYYIRAIDSASNAGTGVLVPTFIPKSAASYVRTSNFEFIYKMAKSVWDASTNKTPPFITASNSFSDLSYSFVAVDSSANMQVTYKWTSFSDTNVTTNNDGINCATQLFNGTQFSAIPSFEIIQFGGMPLSRSTVAPTSATGIFVEFTGKISATDAPKILPNTNLSWAFYNSKIPSANFGSIDKWDTSLVTDMNGMFLSATNFNQNVGLWNTSLVTNMNCMFFRATYFNQNIGGWNTSKVTDMSQMFYDATNFNQNIGSWNTSKVTIIHSMLNGATSFNNGAASGLLDPVNYALYWNTGKVTTMASMFQNATSFNQHIGAFDTTYYTGIRTSLVVTSMMLGATAFIAPNSPLVLVPGTRTLRSTLAAITGVAAYTTAELNASKPTDVSTSRSGTTLTINFTIPSNPGFTAISSYKYSVDGGTTFIAAPAGITSPISVIVSATDNLNIKLRAVNVDGDGAISSENIILLSVVIAPILTSIANPINLGSVLEDASNVAISFTSLQSDTISNQVISAFIVKSVESGSLKIGVTEWNSTTNCIINASNTAYWTPLANANGLLSAFKVSIRNSSLIESLNSEFVKVYVTSVNDTPSGSVTISGIAAQYNTLTANNTLADVDVLGPFSYQWNASGVDIDGATSMTYTLTQSEVGKTIGVTIKYTDGQGTLESVSSAQTSIVLTPPTLTSILNPINVDTVLEDASNVQITFERLLTDASCGDVDGSVTAFIVKSVTSANGSLKIGSSAYNATTNCTIDAANIAYWTPSANVNGSLTVFTVVARDNTLLESTTSPLNVNIYVTPENDLPSGGVTISGAVKQGETLTANNTLADIDVLGPFSYQWDASGVDIDGATSMTYILTQSEVGKTIGVTIKYNDGKGTLESVSSVQSVVVQSIVTVVSSSSPNITDYSLSTLLQVIPESTATGPNTYTYSLSGTDASLYSINSSGEISFIATTKPIVIKTYNVTVTVSDGLGSTTQNISLNVHYNALQVKNSGLFSATQMRLATYTLSEIISAEYTGDQIIQSGFTANDLSGNYSITVAPVISDVVCSLNLLTKIYTSIITFTDISNVIAKSYLYSTDSGATWKSAASNSSPITITTTTIPNIRIKSTYYNIMFSPQSALFTVVNITNLIFGKVTDGYISGGIISILDMSGNLIAGPAITNINGDFSIDCMNLPTYYIVKCVNGTDIATGLPLNYALTSVVNKALFEQTTITSANLILSPITTVVTDIVKNQISSGAPINITTASQKVATALNIPVNDIGIDYINTKNIPIAAAAIKIATIINSIAEATGLPANNLSSSVSNIINTTVTSSKLVIDASVASAVINDTVTTLATLGTPVVLEESVKSSVSSLIAAVSVAMDAPGANMATLYQTSIGSSTLASTITSTSGDVSSQLSLAVESAVVGNIKGNICYRRGTKIVTDQGIIEIQKITEKNSIMGKKILLVSKTVNVYDYMVLIKKDSLFKNVPNEDTYMTGEHKVFYNREMIKAKNLVNGTTIQKVKSLNEEVYNVLLEGETTGKMIANGLIGETLNPKSLMIKLLIDLNKMGLKERTERIKSLNKDMMTIHTSK